MRKLRRYPHANRASQGVFLSMTFRAKSAAQAAVFVGLAIRSCENGDR
jgi:hypothetical protein